MKVGPPSSSRLPKGTFFFPRSRAGKPLLTKRSFLFLSPFSIKVAAIFPRSSRESCVLLFSLFFSRIRMLSPLSPPPRQRARRPPQREEMEKPRPPRDQTLLPRDKKIGRAFLLLRKSQISCTFPRLFRKFSSHGGFFEGEQALEI